MIEAKLKELLEENIDCDVLEIINESHLHANHAGSPGTGQSHFRIVVVSSVFDGLPHIKRHQLVNSFVKPLFLNGLHALSLSTKTPEEYNSMQQGVASVE